MLADDGWEWKDVTHHARGAERDARSWERRSSSRSRSTDQGALWTLCWHAWYFDEALIRPGRVDKKVELGLADNKMQHQS
jgi:hypothetical protein